ncbi:protein-methionine-sulfoxide reductase heme-binding subunit MsrQ [Pseudoxanthobacter sp. M-2]|uniref:sulfite oxidase heme-binding subunit YedZ n=1 Tax=Pseudoxanthobacter sp. M-2 TaxID=3078754 RepID=UPI0038FD3088
MQAPWRDRTGRFSPLKTVTLAGLVLPGLIAAVTLMLADSPAPGAGLPVGGPNIGGPNIGPAGIGGEAARPITDAIHATGDWAVRILLLSLAITPAMRSLRWPRALILRRMIGVAAFAYVAAHFLLYVVDQQFDLAKVASEIALRIYLTIGFVAFVGLAALAATSTDAAVRRMGPVAWQRLHRIAYVLAVLALLHFFMQSKIDVSQPVLMSGFLIWLMGWRLVVALRRRAGREPLPSVVDLLALAVAAAVLTVVTEALWYAVATGVDPWRVIRSNLDFGFVIRPVWWVLAAGLAVTAVAWWRGRTAPKGRVGRPQRPAPAA